MGDTTAPVKLGGGFRPLRVAGKDDIMSVVTKVKMSASYATGGDTLVLPTEYSRRGKLQSVEVLTPQLGTRVFAWDGSVATPKVKAFTAYPATEVTAATNLSTVELLVRFTFEGGM